MSIIRGLATALAVAGATFSAQAQTASKPAASTPTATPAACRALADIDLPDTVVQSAVPVAADGKVAAYCRVKGFVRPAINFELHLPAADWNGKFFQAGCGGYCGRLDKTSYFNTGKVRNYAVILTDTGHWGATSADARWLESNPATAFDDFTVRHIPEVARVGKALTRAYYQQEIRYSYFNGCSGGGRQGLTAAIRYPDLFDGIVSGAPSTDTGGTWASFAYLTVANRDKQGQPIFDPAKLTLLQNAVAKTCGDPTGLVIDPFGCKFEAKSLQCPAGKSDATCLTSAEVDVVGRWYAPPRLKSGEAVYPAGLAYGSEMFWGSPNVKPDAMFARQRQSSNQSFRYIYARGTPVDPAMEVDLDRDYARTMKSPDAAKLTGDLTKYRDRKGKVIIYQGLADTIVNPGETAVYHDTVMKALGERASDSVRTFMVPGLGHCTNAANIVSPGFTDSDFDPMTALEAWVEQGRAPDQIVATKRDASGKVARGLPLCPFPQRAEYTGTGATTEAANWRCK